MPTSCYSPADAIIKPEIDAEDFARMCKALGHPARVKLLKHLADVGDCYFGSLTDILPLAPSTVSQHVSILKDAGLICGSSDVTRVCYCVNPERLQLLKSMMVGL
jgi:ArsR family transcriptional regulator